MAVYKCTKCGALVADGDVLVVQTIRARRFGQPEDCTAGESEDRCPECESAGTLDVLTTHGGYYSWRPAA